MKTAMLYLLSGCLLIALAMTGSSQPHEDRDISDDLFCGECHRCDAPTEENPCLRTCPRDKVERQQSYDPEVGPDIVVLDLLENEYEAVHFSHKLHAEMSAMGHSCLDCHHFNDPNRITACKECHPPGISSENIRQPGLKGAYHRQCLGCHQEWTGASQCEVCHAKKGSEVAGDHELITPRPGRRFAQLEEPDIKVWESTYGGGTIVTLHHRNHTEKYGIECAACHHQEGCSFCHSQNERRDLEDVRHSEEALHAICNTCHEEMSCKQCHMKEIAEEFSHDRTGWPLKAYHAKLKCTSCHGNPYHFTKPSGRCSACHRGWASDSFDHSVTGLTLSESHIEIDCQDCHDPDNYMATPTCDECHEEDVSYPEFMPGD